MKDQVFDISIELLPSFVIVTAQNEVDVPAATVVKGNLIQNLMFLFTWSSYVKK